MTTRFLRPASSAFASAASSLSKAPSASPRTHRLLARTMSSSAPAKAEWLAVIPDKPNTLAKRLEVRPVHFANLEATKKKGILKFGGAILQDTPSDPSDANTFDFKGSSIILEAGSKAEVIDFLKTDVYYQEGVWDVENAQIYYLKTALREQFP